MDTAADEETLPMWIADMDFKTFPPVTEALSAMAAGGFFGYNTVPEAFSDAVVHWWQTQHEFTVEKNWILPATGVVSGISAVINALSQPGDEVIIQTPGYNHFFNLLDGCGSSIVVNELICTEGDYTMNFEDLAFKAASGRAKILLLCNPHNPVGRAWSREELHQVAAICLKNDVIVISDEIHSDLVFTGRKHIPFQSVALTHGLRAVTCSAASKTFNLSGLHAAYLFVTDEAMKKKISKKLWASASAVPGLFAVEALVVSYRQGSVWLEQLKDYVWSNYLYLLAFTSDHLPQIRVTPLQSTYLVWLDCSATRLSSAVLSDKLLKEQQLWLNAGHMYGNAGEGFLRINIACPLIILQQGLKRLEFVFNNLSAAE